MAYQTKEVKDLVPGDYVVINVPAVVAVVEITDNEPHRAKYQGNKAMTYMVVEMDPDGVTEIGERVAVEYRGHPTAV